MRNEKETVTFANISQARNFSVVCVATLRGGLFAGRGMSTDHLYTYIPRLSVVRKLRGKEEVLWLCFVCECFGESSRQTQ